MKRFSINTIKAKVFHIYVGVELASKDNLKYSKKNLMIEIKVVGQLLTLYGLGERLGRYLKTAY